MNSATSCHEIPACPGLYIDAFFGSFLRKTHNADSVFVLSHYHGDHYGNLPKENKYQGPALIHCTTVTASLLRNVHQVPSCYVVEHKYGETFVVQLRGAHNGQQTVNMTFYDANHCPGAAIILIELPDGKVHLHTGDMRYHDKMKSYPLLQDAVLNKKIDSVFLDTTYANPKHDFVPQEVAIESIASQVHELLGSQRPKDHKTLVLLSCYSIGKEKVLWEASNRCNQLVYVSERKLERLQYIEGYRDVSSQIVHRCTRDPEQSDIHVVPMGLAGEMWPFFRPNFRGCVDHAKTVPRDYRRIVAFIPTGWAEASNWNKKHSISRGKCDDIDVEVRLISYSEHSAYSELQTFVEFLKPRKIIPTVFKDQNDAQKIVARFPIDLNRAKRHFIDSMFRTSPTSKPVSTKQEVSADGAARKRIRQDSSVENNVAVLEQMGFDEREAAYALESCNGKVEDAIEKLLNKETKIVTDTDTQSPSSKGSKTKGSQLITNFFAAKKPSMRF